jgi:large subunit ribosomal protein L14e
LVDGPSEEKGKEVPRQAVALANVALTPIVMKIPRAIGPGPLASKWKEAGIEKKWKESAFAKGRDRGAKRRALNDFERFKVMRLRKQVSKSVLLFQCAYSVASPSTARDQRRIY